MFWDLEAFSAGEINPFVLPPFTTLERWRRLVYRCSPVAIVTAAACSVSVNPCFGCRQLGNVCRNPRYCPVCACVNVCMCGRLCLCLSGFLRSYVTKTVPQTFICIEMCPFTCLSFTYLQQMRNCALHIGVSHSYSDLVIYLLKTQAVSEGTVMLKRSSPLSYAQRPVNLNHNIDLLSIFVVCFTKGSVSMRMLTLLRIEISFLNLHIVF